MHEWTRVLETNNRGTGDKVGGHQLVFQRIEQQTFESAATDAAAVLTRPGPTGPAAGKMIGANCGQRAATDSAEGLLSPTMLPEAGRAGVLDPVAAADRVQAMLD